MSRRFQYSGTIAPDDPQHYTIPVEAKGHAAWLAAADSRIVAPRHFNLKDGKRVAQWAKTLQSRVSGFNPKSDCGGNFMPYKFQANNNCYNYACNIATNSFAQPGRRSMTALVTPSGRLTGGTVIAAAEGDGLVCLGGPGLTLKAILEDIGSLFSPADGHLVAMFISAAKAAIRWKGDYHWVRCDDWSGREWSHKNGPDTVSNFDFMGRPIQDPTKSRWTINLGPSHPSGVSGKQVIYKFGAWMFVPYQKVKII